MTNKSRTSPRARYAAVALLAATALSACGGGGDGYQSSQPVTTSGAPSTPEPSPPKPTNVMTPACSNCGAVDADTYAGTGVGVWKGINATADTVDMPIRISGLKGQDVTLIFTNHTGIARTMPNISLTTSQMPSIVASALRWDNDTQETKRRISDFNREGWVALAGKRGSTPYHSATSEPTPAAVHDVRTWYHSDNSERSAMLVRQLKASDGTTINFWVEGSENDASKVSPDIVARLADSFA